MRDAASKDIASFRAELEETRSQHYFDIAELCAKFSNNPELQASLTRPARLSQASDSVSKQDLASLMEEKELALKEQMTQALESTQMALSKNFLEEHRKLLVQVVEDREQRSEEVHTINSRLDTMSVALQSGVVPSAGVSSTVGFSSQLDSMREAIQELRVNMVQEPGENGTDSEKQVKAKIASERGLYDELASVRKDIASCLDAANAAVRLGEHLTNELHIEVEARCADMKALRSWVTTLMEASPSDDRQQGQVVLRDEDATDVHVIAQNLRQPAGQNVQSGQIIDDPRAALDKLRWSVNSTEQSGWFGVAQSPYNRARDATSGVTLQKRGEAIERVGSPGPKSAKDPSIASLSSLHGAQPISSSWNSQHTIVSGRNPRDMPQGIDSGGNSPGIMLSGGNVVARRHQMSMPAGERYLANQRLASQLTPGAPAGAAGGTSSQTTLNASLVSPRQPRVPSPIKNYHLVQRAPSDMGQVRDVQEGVVRRQQASQSPLRETPTPLATSRTIERQVSAAFEGPMLGNIVTTAGGIPIGAASSATMPPGIRLDSSRRMGNPVQLARSLSPVQRRSG
jgi:hypothetical protein